MKLFTYLYDLFERLSSHKLAVYIMSINSFIESIFWPIPADVMQFFGMALRLAQELSYLYGGGDLWVDGQIDDEKVK